MAPQAETLDLTKSDFGYCTVQLLCEHIKRWSKTIAQTAPETDPFLIRLVVDEFMKNVLHGEYAVVRFIPLRDGSFLLLSENRIGEDHLTENGHCGTLIIHTLVGEENYQLILDGDRYHGYLRLDPHAMTAT